MSAGNPTAGPWTADFDRRHGLWVITADGGEVEICQDRGWGSEFEAEDKANARLIAAAPDSHEANVKTVEAFSAAFGINETWTDVRIYDDLPSSGLALAYFAARDAVAKATGEQP